MYSDQNKALLGSYRDPGNCTNNLQSLKYYYSVTLNKYFGGRHKEGTFIFKRFILQFKAGVVTGVKLWNSL